MRQVTITVSEADAVEIAEALESKRRLVESGYFDPEDTPGDNTRWASDLARIQAVVEYAETRGRGEPMDVYVVWNDDHDVVAVVSDRNVAVELTDVNPDWAWDAYRVLETRDEAVDRDLFPMDDDGHVERVAEPVPFGECSRCQTTTVRQVGGEYLCIGCQELAGVTPLMEDPPQLIGEEPAADFLERVFPDPEEDPTARTPF